MRIGAIKGFGVLAAAVGLAACDPVSQTPAPPPQAAPSTAAPAPDAPSANSRALTQYYARIQQNYLARGLLRVDGGGVDTPITQRMLVDNFIRIALFEEFSSVGGRIVRRETETRLHRWNSPVRMKVHFGASVPAATQAKDRAEVEKFAGRLERLTGLDFSFADQGANYHVFIVNEDERRKIGPKLREISPDIDEAAIHTVENMRRSTLCLVFAIDGAARGVYSKAVAVIRAEHPDLLRKSCIHEELAQGMGLPNDSPLARPSVFNDDEEFGLLTTHDEYLLQMLYDPRMKPGMSADEARPVVTQIAAEILGGES